MKIYIDLAKQAITKTSDEKVYEGDFYSNVFEVLFYNYENENWFPTMSQLAPNGRSVGDFTADALVVGESHTYVKDGTTYLKFTFTMGATWVLMKGRSEFYIWFNRIGGSIVQKKCVGRVNVMIDQSTDNYFIADPLFNPAVKTYINACVAKIGDGSPKYFDTAANIALLTEDKGLAVATDTGHLYYWDSTSTSTTKYTDSGLVYNDLSLYYTKTQADALLANKADKSTTYTKTESDNRYAQLGANNTFTGDNDFQGESLFDDDINQAYGNFSTQGNVSAEGNVEAQSFTKNGTDLDDIYASKSDTYTKTESDILLNEKANKSNTYTKSEVNTALNGKADKSTTYTKTETDNLLSAKADKTTVNGIDNRVGALENEITDLQSVQNVVDVVATKSALNSYNTSKLEENDKIQVIADETHSGASTIYNWNGSAWQYVGAYGGNTYTKTQTDNLLNAKADKSTTYTKTETDTLLNTKADKSTTYTKAEIDTILNTVVIEKSFESLPVDQITIRGYVTQEVFNSIGSRTQVQLRVYDSNNDMTFILTQNSPGTNGYNFKCTFNSPIDADGMIEAEGAIYEDREYSFVLRNIKIYTEAEVDTLLSSKLNKLNPTGTGSISMNSGTASGTNSYANGSGATASGNFSKAKGPGATASGNYSTAIHGTATGDDSVAYGNSANASGDNSLAFGPQCKAKGNNQVVTGKFNIPDTSSLEIVGNGAYMNTSNARLLDANGDEYLAGDLYINTTFTKDGNGDLSAKNGTKITDYVDNAINDLRWELGSHTLDVTTDTDTKYLKNVPSGAIGCQINSVGGMSYKVNDIIRDSAVTSVVSKDSSNNTIATLTIPSAVQNLTGYGWGINNTCYNYIDFDRKVFVKKVGRVDLGSLTWTYTTPYGANNAFYCPNGIGAKSAFNDQIFNGLCELYTPTSRNDIYNNQTDKKMCLTGSILITIVDNSYTSAQDFKSAMNGVYLYYELATPIETDISAYLTTDTIDVEPLGTLEFTNTYNQDVPSDIDYLIEEVKA